MVNAAYVLPGGGRQLPSAACHCLLGVGAQHGWFSPSIKKEKLEIQFLKGDTSQMLKVGNKLI